MRISNLKINPKKIRKVGKRIVLTTLVGVMIVSGGKQLVSKIKESNHIKNSTVEEIMMEYNGVSDITCDLNQANLGEIAKVEQYLDLSERLHDLDLDTNLVLLREEDELMSPEEIETLISLYNEGGETRKTVKPSLTKQEALVNFFLARQGYGITADACLDTLKAIVADAKEEYEGDNVSIDKTDIKVPGDYFHSQPEDRYIEGLRIIQNSDVGELLESVYAMQQQEKMAYHISIDDPELYAYNRDRNQLIRRAINNLKVTLTHDYTANRRGKIVTSK